MSRRYFSLLFPVLLLVSGFTLMPPQQTPEKAAQEAAESWLRLIDSGKYAESWDELAEVAKAKVPKDSWEKLRDSAGKPGDTEESKPRKLLVATPLPSAMSVPGQASVILEYQRPYDRHRSTFEVVELVLEAGRGWRVAYYMKMAAVCLYNPSSDPNHKAEARSYAIPERPPPNVEPYVGRGVPGTEPITTPSFRKNPKGGTIVLVAKKDLPVTIETVDGTDGGIGTGSGGGIGSGSGTGAGPGSGYNMGGGNPTLGGDRNGVATAVDQRPVPLNTPQPRYTKEARDNKVQGVVIARVLVGADGTVKQVRVVRGLPDGLDEQAIQAAFQLRFRPAMKGGQPVAFWQTVSIEFNLK